MPTMVATRPIGNVQPDPRLPHARVLNQLRLRLDLHINVVGCPKAKDQNKKTKVQTNKCLDGLGFIIMLRGKQAQSNCLTQGDFLFVVYFGGKVGSSFFSQYYRYQFEK